MAKDTYYFSHDSNAITDTKILNMRADYGLEGYGLYWAIVEMMRNEKDYKLKCDKSTYRAIKVLTNATIDIEEYVSACIEDYKLFIKDGEYFYSKSLLQRMEEYERKRQINRENGKLGGRPKKVKNKTEEKPNGFEFETESKPNSNPKKPKESKGKEIKENKNKVKKKEQEKIHFAEFVSMTNADYEKLVSTHGKQFADQCIAVLDNYKGANGKDYKSDYRAILSWVVEKVKREYPHLIKKENELYQHELTYSKDDFTEEQYNRLVKGKMSKEEMIKILEEKNV